MRKMFNNFVANSRANVAIMFAICLGPLFAIIGATVDYSQISRLHSRAQQAADAAVLAGASGLMSKGILSGGSEVIPDETQAILIYLNSEIPKYYEANMYNDARHHFREYKIGYEPTSKSIELTVNYDYKPWIIGIFDRKLFDVGVTSSVNVQVDQGGAISLFLVLDTSGSMGWQNRMVSLKAAVGGLGLQFAETDPDKEYVRTGAIAYSHYAHRTHRLEWGFEGVNQYVQRLVPSGGTNSSRAMNIAYKQLRRNQETTEHEKKNGQEPTKMLVFMTDGANSSSKYDQKTKRTCDWAKRDEIEIYTVAFQAPETGKKLLQYCASSVSHYYDANDATELLAAFRQIGGGRSKGSGIEQIELGQPLARYRQARYANSKLIVLHL